MIERKSANRTTVIISSVNALKHSVVNTKGKLRKGIRHPRKPAGIPKDCFWWIKKLRPRTYVKRIMISVRYDIQRDFFKN